MILLIERKKKEKKGGKESKKQRMETRNDSVIEKIDGEGDEGQRQEQRQGQRQGQRQEQDSSHILSPTSQPYDSPTSQPYDSPTSQPYDSPTSQPYNYCYILYNELNNLTYNGYTNNLQRRIRQHNGEIKGGAKYTTRRKVGWKYLAYVTVEDPAFTQKRALSWEWHCKYPTGHRPRRKEFNSPEGRLRGLQLALQNPKFKDLTFITYVCAKYAHLVEGCNLIP